MIEQKPKKRKPPSKFDYNKERGNKFQKYDLIPFITHYHDSSGNKYKVDDTKQFNGKTYYFATAPSKGTSSGCI